MSRAVFLLNRKKPAVAGWPQRRRRSLLKVEDADPTCAVSNFFFFFFAFFLTLWLFEIIVLGLSDTAAVWRFVANVCQRHEES